MTTSTQTKNRSKGDKMFVYCIRFSKHPDKVKIGCSIDFENRLYGLEHHHGEVLNSFVWEVGKDYQMVEQYVHNRLTERRTLVEGDGGTEFFITEGMTFGEVVSLVSGVISNRLESGCSDQSEPNLYKSFCVNSFSGRISAVEKVVFLVVLSYSGKGFSKSQETVSTLIRATGVTRPTLFKSIRKLVSVGLITSSKTFHKQTPTYALDFDGVRKLTGIDLNNFVEKVEPL